MNHSGQLPTVFTISAELVKELQDLARAVAAHSSYTMLTVPAADFPAWLAALGRESFYAHTTRSGSRFIRSGYAVIGPDTLKAPMLSVSCDTPPAPWVSFPETEGDRRYMFRYTTNPLAHNETESTQ